MRILLEVKKHLDINNFKNGDDAIFNHAESSIKDITKTIYQPLETASYNRSGFYDLASGVIDISEIDRCNEILSDDSKWKDAFLQIIKGEWTLRQSPTTVKSFSVTLLSFYDKVLSTPSDRIYELLPLLLLADNAKAELFYFCGLWLGLGDTPEKTAQTKNRKATTIKKNKIDTRWAWPKSIIEKLHVDGEFDECTTLTEVAQRTRDELVFLIREGKGKEKREKKHPWSVGTIIRIFEQVYGITPKSYKQPLTLKSNAKG